MDAAEVDGPNIGIELRERGHKVSIEVPMALLEQGDSDPAGREALRIRLKVRRDKMLFRAPPTPLSKRIVASAAPSFGGRPGWGGRR